MSVAILMISRVYIFYSWNYIFNIFPGLEFFLDYRVNGFISGKVTNILCVFVCLCGSTYVMTFHATLFELLSSFLREPSVSVIVKIFIDLFGCTRC